jgi:hypothetical protein
MVAGFFQADHTSNRVDLMHEKSSFLVRQGGLQGSSLRSNIGFGIRFTR